MTLLKQAGVDLGKPETVRAVVDRVLAKSTGAVWLEPDDLWTMLRASLVIAASFLETPVPE
jgi:hypothetical protein